MFSITQGTFLMVRSSHLFCAQTLYWSSSTPCMCIQGSQNLCAAQGFCVLFFFFKHTSLLQTPRFFHTVVQTHWTSLLYSLPFEFIIGSRWKGWAFDYLTHLLSAEAEVVYGPHVGKLHHFNLKTENKRWFRAINFHSGHRRQRSSKAKTEILEVAQNHLCNK